MSVEKYVESKEEATDWVTVMEEGDNEGGEVGECCIQISICLD